MSQIHYLRELGAIKKRIILFTSELKQMHSSGTIKRNKNSVDDIYLKILNELRALKMTSIIRYGQQYSDLLPDKSQLATLFALRTLKERFFLRKINDEILDAGGDLDFRPVIFTTVRSDEVHPVELTERILRENAAAHSMMIDCYTQLIGLINNVDGYSNLQWLLHSIAVMEQKYHQNEQRYGKMKLAA